ncbi:unnamed protein product [Closterium sp. Naga37s-1]|nr:unnamed protein product [Closterium sp. Naga37s-1]
MCIADMRQHMEGVMVSMHHMATGLGKEVWVSEVGPIWVTGNGVGVMLLTARQIVQAVNIMGASTWIFWIYRLNDTEVKPLDLVISKKLYMMQQFVCGAPRGSLPLRIDTSDGCQHCIAAFFHPDQHFVSIFIVNQRDTTHTSTFQIEDFVPFDVGQDCVLETYRTSATENNTLVATQRYTDVPASIQVAALGSSMTSVVLRNVDPAYCVVQGWWNPLHSLPHIAARKGRIASVMQVAARRSAALWHLWCCALWTPPLRSGGETPLP